VSLSKVISGEPVPIGTPQVKVAVAWVALSIVTESAITPANSTEAVNPEISKSVPVKTSVFSSVCEVVSRCGKSVLIFIVQSAAVAHYNLVESVLL